MARRDTYVIEFRTTGTARVQRNIAAIGKSANSARRALAFLRSFLVIFASVAIFSGIFRLADAFTNLNNRLKLLTDNKEVLVALRQETFRLANDNRVAVEQFGEILFRVSRATLALGLDFNQLVRITDTVTKAVKLSGSTAASSEAGLIQFAQGLAGAALEGQELASVVEQLPALADIIAREFTPELIELGFLDPRANTEALGGFLRPLNRAQLGLLKLPRLIKAIEAAFDKTADSFGRVDITIGDAFTQLRNKAILFAGTLNDTTGAADGMVRAIQFIGDHLGAIVIGITAFISAFALNLVIAQMVSLGAKIAVVAKLVFNLGAAFVRITAFIGRVVLGIGAAVSGALGIVAVIAAWFLFGDAIKETIASMGGLANIAKNTIAFMIALVITLADEWELLAKALPALFIRGLAAILEALGSFVLSSLTFFKDLFVDIVTLAAETGSTIGQILIAAITGDFEKAGKLADDFFGEGLVSALTTPQGALQAVIDGVEALGGFLVESDEAARKLGGTLEGNFQKTLETINALLSDPNSGLSPEAIAELLKNLPRGSSQFGIPDRPDEAEAKRIAKIQDALDGLVASISPYNTAIQAQAEAEKILADAIKEKLELLLPEEEILRRVARASLGAGNAVTDYKETIRLLNGELGKNLTVTEKAILTAAAFQELAGNFTSLLEAVSPLAAATRRYAEAQNEANLAAQNGVTTQAMANEVLKRTERDMVGVGNAATDYEEKLENLQKALDRTSISQEEFRLEASRLRVEFLETQRTMAAGAERAMLKIEEAYSDTASNVEAAFTTVFQNLEDRLVDFVETGIFSIREFLDVIRQEIARAFIREAIGEITGLFNDVLGNILPGAGGGEDPEAAASQALVAAKQAETAAVQAMVGTKQGETGAVQAVIAANQTLITATQPLALEFQLMQPNLLTMNTQLTGLGTATLPAFTSACIAATACLNQLTIACQSAVASGGEEGGAGGGLGSLFGVIADATAGTFGGGVPGTDGFGSVNDGGSLGGQGAGNFDILNQGSFASGGSFMVGGRNSAAIPNGGLDNRLVQFNAQRGEEVEIIPRGGRRRMGGTNVTINVTGAENADRFRRNQGGVTSRIAAAVSRAEQRNR